MPSSLLEKERTPYLGAGHSQILGAQFWMIYIKHLRLSVGRKPVSQTSTGMKRSGAQRWHGPPRGRRDLSLTRSRSGRCLPCSPRRRARSPALAEVAVPLVDAAAGGRGPPRRRALTGWRERGEEVRCGWSGDAGGSAL